MFYAKILFRKTAFLLVGTIAAITLLSGCETLNIGTTPQSTTTTQTQMEGNAPSTEVPGAPDLFQDPEGNVQPEDTDKVSEEQDKEMTYIIQMSNKTETTGEYTAYDPSVPQLALANSGDVVLYFFASWCPTCRALEADINANLASIPARTHILKVDYDTETELKNRYGVTYQHTFVQVDASGNQIKKWNGSSTLAALVEEIQ